MNDDVEIILEPEVQHDITPPAPVIYRDCEVCGKIIRKWPAQCIFCHCWLHNHGCGYLASKEGSEPGMIIGGLCCALCYRDNVNEFSETSLQDIKRLLK